MYSSFIIPNLAILEKFAKQLVYILQNLPPRDYACVICLDGDIGVGKTTLTQMIAQNLGITETVQSPTFVIKKIYPIANNKFSNLIHIDAYRLDDLNTNLDTLEFKKDFANKENLIIIEWPSIIVDSIPDTALTIILKHKKEGRLVILPSEISLPSKNTPIHME